MPGFSDNAAPCPTTSTLASDPVQADFAAALDAALPEAKRTLRHLPRSALPMDPSVVPDDAILLLDTTVYIDGVKRVGLEWQGAGSTQPRYKPVDTPENRARNRRVEIIQVEQPETHQ